MSKEKRPRIVASILRHSQTLSQLAQESSEYAFANANDADWRRDPKGKFIDESGVEIRVIDSKADLSTFKKVQMLRKNADKTVGIHEIDANYEINLNAFTVEDFFAGNSAVTLEELDKLLLDLTQSIQAQMALAASQNLDK